MAEGKKTCEYPDGFEYEGKQYVEVFPLDILEKIKYQFELRDDDVLITTYPKSGTSWFIEIVWLLMNDADVAKANETPQEARIPHIEAKIPDMKPEVEKLEESDSPRIIKSHLSFDFFLRELKLNKKKSKVILGVRNPKDTLISFYHFHRMNPFLADEFFEFSDFYEMFQNKRLLCGDWFDFVLGYQKNCYHFDHFWLKYEDLHKDFMGTIKQLAAFLGKELSEEKLQAIAKHVAFDTMKDNKMVNKTIYPIFRTDVSPFMREGKVGDWKNHLTEEQNQYIDKLYRERIEGTGLNLDFQLTKTDQKEYATPEPLPLEDNNLEDHKLEDSKLEDIKLEDPNLEDAKLEDSKLEVSEEKHFVASETIDTHL